jgi:glucokinase
VGNGLILNDRVWHGTTGMGGEGGHIVVQPDGAPCGCGGHGCLEQYASAPAIVRMGRERIGAQSPDTAVEIASLARAGNQQAISIFETVGESLAIALTALVNTLNLQLYLLGGGVCEAWDLFSATMFRELHERSYVYRLTKPDHPASGRLERHRTYVLRAQLGTSAGLLGSCLLPVQEDAAASVELEDAVGT